MGEATVSEIRNRAISRNSLLRKQSILQTSSRVSTQRPASKGFRGWKREKLGAVVTLTLLPQVSLAPGPRQPACSPHPKLETLGDRSTRLGVPGTTPGSSAGGRGMAIRRRGLRGIGGYDCLGGEGAAEGSS